MKRKRHFLFTLWTVLVLPFLLFCSGCIGDSGYFVVRNDSTLNFQSPQNQGDIKYSIYLITMDQVSNYWQHIDAGCQKAAREIGGIDYHWTAPPKNNAADQCRFIDQAVADGADAILLSASSPTALNESLERAKQAGVRLIYVDSAATFEATTSLVTDNHTAGKKAGDTMKKALSEAGITSGTIGLVVGSSNGKNAILRDQGFRDAFEGTNFTIAPTVAQNGNPHNIEQEVTAHPEYVAFFGANEQVTRIISKLIMESGTKQIIVGFDTSDYTLSMIQRGVIYATMQQRPEQMGYNGMHIAVDSLAKDPEYTFPPTDMGVKVITKESI